MYNHSDGSPFADMRVLLHTTLEATLLISTDFCQMYSVDDDAT